MPTLPARGPGLPDDLPHLLFEAAGVGMVLYRPGAAGLTANRAFREITGYAAEELAAMDIGALACEHERVRNDTMHGELLRGAAASHRRDKRLLHKDGRVLWVDFSCTLARDAQGQPSHFIAQVLDITGRKHAESELLDNQQRLQHLCDLTTDWYWEQDAEFRFSRFLGAPATAPLLARRVQSLMGQRRWDMDGMQALNCSWDEHKATLAAHLPYRNFEFGNLEGDDPFVISTSGEPMFAADGSFAGYRGTSRDVTAARRAQAQLDSLNYKLEERVRERTRALELANRELEAFAYSIAHDLRAPMMAVGGFSRLLLRNLQKQDAANAHYLERVLANVERMSELTDALLLLAGVSAGEIGHDCLDLGDVARELAAGLFDAGGVRHAELHVHGEMPACGSPRLLRQAMANLLANAWKFTAREAQPVIEVGCAAPGFDARMQVYYVRDNGAGFDMQYAADLFQPFRRLHTEAEFPGTGIGLAVVRKIIERHGGTVWAEAEPGRGATFYFSLPASNVLQEAGRVSI
ncbi:MAG: ATP-binding protein [Pseudomonadota bacterium]